MRFVKRLTPLIILFAMIFILSACGSSLQKPTGLENNETEHNENVMVEAIEVEDEDTSNNENQSDENSNELNEDDQNSNDDSSEENKEENKTTNKQKKDQSQNKKDSSKNNEANQDKAKSDETDKETKTKDKPKKKDNRQDKAEQSDNNGEKSKKTKKPKQETKPNKPKKSVILSVVISKDEIPLPPTEIEIKDGDTALDALMTADQKYTLHLDFRGGQGSSAYIQGIDNVYEFDRGQGSGWMFSVNTIFPNRGVGVTPLKDGDRVEYLYTTNLGEDLGANLEPFR